jgi:hypothetical protein
MKQGTSESQNKSEGNHFQAWRRLSPAQTLNLSRAAISLRVTDTTPLGILNSATTT